MDKNQVTGLVLISLLLITYIYFFAPDPQQQPLYSPDQQPTTEAAAGGSTSGSAELAPAVASLPDSLANARFGFWSNGLRSTALPEEVTLENSQMVITFSAKGGVVTKVLLKNHVDYRKNPLILTQDGSTQLAETIRSGAETIDLNQLYYRANRLSDREVVFSIADEEGRRFAKKYTLSESGYDFTYAYEAAGIPLTTDNQSVRVWWRGQMRKVEKDLEQARIRTTVNYYLADGTFDYLSETSTSPESATLEQPVSWVSMKQKFFNMGIIADAPFTNTKVALAYNQADTSYVKNAEIELDMPLASMMAPQSGIRFYYGPNDYAICKQVTPGYEQNVYLGWKGLAFLNLYLIMPLFNFLEGFIPNYGIIILILVLIVKTILFPLTYRSYLSMAKMRVLKPEMDEIKERVGDDMMKVQQETTKLYQQVGVNPLSGCIPVLLQMPVFIAMYNFFPNTIQLRQESFLWADDLSSYDSILDLPFTIPFYGAHVSLFTLLMTVSTIIYTYYNNQISTAATPPAMKTVSYITPVFFMFFFNTFSSGLTYYYFVSNVITVAQQLIIRRFVDDDRIRRILDENKKKNANKQKTGFQKRLEDALKAQEEAKRNKKKK